jgi:hypothetical protein
LGCDLESARSVLSLIQRSLPVVSVTFEMGREPVATSLRGLLALQLDTMARHAHLRSTEQAVACLQAIDAALQRMSNTADAVLTVLDGSGHCLVADVTARNILALWQEIVAAHNKEDMGSPPGAGGPLYRCGSVPGALCDRHAALHNRPPRRRAHVTTMVPCHGPALRCHCDFLLVDWAWLAGVNPACRDGSLVCFGAGSRRNHADLSAPRRRPSDPGRKAQPREEQPGS